MAVSDPVYRIFLKSPQIVPVLRPLPFGKGQARINGEYSVIMINSANFYTGDTT
jgi:hypothetical protein